MCNLVEHRPGMALAQLKAGVHPGGAADGEKGKKDPEYKAKGWRPQVCMDQAKRSGGARAQPPSSYEGILTYRCAQSSSFTGRGLNNAQPLVLHNAGG